MGMAALAATMGLVAATAVALVSYGILPGIKSSSALGQVEASVPLPKDISFLKPCHVMNGHHPVMVFIGSRLFRELHAKNDKAS
jgi:hypothetical protein